MYAYMVLAENKIAAILKVPLYYYHFLRRVTFEFNYPNSTLLICMAG